MDLGLSGKRALVLGSSKGLGHGIAEMLAAEGAHVILVGRNEERLAQAAETITARGAGTARFVAVDMNGPGAVDRLMEGVEGGPGAVDILVNNSGGPPPGNISAVGASDWTKHFETMVVTLIETAGRVLPGMRERKWGRILTIASSGVIQPIPNLGISNTLRVSLVNWGKTLSLEVAPDGVTVNTILPGRIHTERVDQLDQSASDKQGKDIEAVRAAARAQIPVGRYGTVEEFASVATFLVSARASYVTGSVTLVDGGLVKSW
ncbi:SDR family oxidoreductase [Skermanella rosea]|uniref:SDR family oxidoreductase n=1 Tax=Skermanella rosea TaxID=1817965 RepID=UPI001933C4B5|nr:SDR family oxidoreductase [Skermanella rosea]UEM03058.1 SDR family oxidoreductase [Skermanella rosea]